MLKLAICDDEVSCRERLTALVNEYGAARRAELAVSAFSAAAQVPDSGECFDIYLLDILMPGLSGMDLAVELRERDETADLIFLTSSPEFALESYTVRALDYLLKPVDREKLFSSLDRAIARRRERARDELVLRSDGRLVSVPLGSIEYVEARQEKLIFRLNSGETLETAGALSSLEERLLADPRFLKPHRAYLVNMAFIRELTGRELCLSDAFVPVPIARGHFAEVKEAYLAYMTFAMKRGERTGVLLFGLQHII